MIVTPPPAPQGIPLETLLSRSWELFKRNWIVALPPVIAMVVVLAGVAVIFTAVIVALFAHGLARAPSPHVGGGLFAGILIFMGLALVVTIWSQVAMFGMADAAWAKGTATFADGFAAFRARGGALVVAMIGIFGLGIAAFILFLPTLGLSFLALPLFTMYVLPSVVTGGRDGFAAIGESFDLVKRFFGPSAIVLLVLLAIQYGISMLASAPLFPIQFAMVSSAGQGTQPQLPALGLLVFAGVWFVLAMVVAQAYVGFYTIAIVGMYRSLFAQPVMGRPPGPGDIVPA
ncbi:MAG TPA: hypothetical protein VGU66_20085 [Candidatus Elarobacter sp.]|nr:hypothetical protein [Candidatus Elarobacter sp.]